MKIKTDWNSHHHGYAGRIFVLSLIVEYLKFNLYLFKK